jgi:hypothetical protein
MIAWRDLAWSPEDSSQPTVGGTRGRDPGGWGRLAGGMFVHTIEEPVWQSGAGAPPAGELKMRENEDIYMYSICIYICNNTVYCICMGDSRHADTYLD